MWQLDGKRYWAEERTVVPGDNMAEMFWNGVAKRGEDRCKHQGGQQRRQLLGRRSEQGGGSEHGRHQMVILVTKYTNTVAAPTDRPST